MLSVSLCEKENPKKTAGDEKCYNLTISEAILWHLYGLASIMSFQGFVNSNQPPEIQVDFAMDSKQPVQRPFFPVFKGR